MGAGILLDIRHERFAQLVASGLTPYKAKKQITMPSGPRWTAKSLMAMPEIQDRIKTLLESAAKKASLTREGIIREVQEEWTLARIAGQHSAALKAAEMLGGELHNMFRNKVEIGRVGEFDGKSEEELKMFILNTMKELGMDQPEPEPLPQITNQPDTQTEH